MRQGLMLWAAMAAVLAGTTGAGFIAEQAVAAASVAAIPDHPVKIAVRRVT